MENLYHPFHAIFLGPTIERDYATVYAITRSKFFLMSGKTVDEVKKKLQENRKGLYVFTGKEIPGHKDSFKNMTHLKEGYNDLSTNGIIMIVTTFNPFTD